MRLSLKPIRDNQILFKLYLLLKVFSSCRNTLFKSCYPVFECPQEVFFGNTLRTLKYSRTTGLSRLKMASSKFFFEQGEKSKVTVPEFPLSKCRTHRNTVALDIEVPNASCFKVSQISVAFFRIAVQTFMQAFISLEEMVKLFLLISLSVKNTLILNGCHIKTCEDAALIISNLVQQSTNTRRRQYSL